MDTSRTVRLKSCVPLERTVSPLKCKGVIGLEGAENQQNKPKTRQRRLATATAIRASPKDNKWRKGDCLSPSVSMADEASTPDSRPSRSSDGLESEICSLDDGGTLKGRAIVLCGVVSTDGNEKFVARAHYCNDVFVPFTVIRL
jgi:hypothetical protein